jgi:4-hydroxyphenylpyruvate dioxygenase
VRDPSSYVLQQGRVRLVLTGALHSEHPVAVHRASTATA